jgi:hypothetical protein
MRCAHLGWQSRTGKDQMSEPRPVEVRDLVKRLSATRRRELKVPT